MNERNPEATQTPLAEARRRSYTGRNQGHAEAVTHPDADRSDRRGRHAREALSRTEGLLIAMFVTLSAAILGAGAVGYTSLSGQLLDMQRQIGNVQVEVGNLRAEMHEEIGLLRTEMGKLSERVARIETVLQTHHGPLSGP